MFNMYAISLFLFIFSYILVSVNILSINIFSIFVSILLLYQFIIFILGFLFYYALYRNRIDVYLLNNNYFVVDTYDNKTYHNIEMLSLDKDIIKLLLIRKNVNEYNEYVNKIIRLDKISLIILIVIFILMIINLYKLSLPIYLKYEVIATMWFIVGNNILKNLIKKIILEKFKKEMM